MDQLNELAVEQERLGKEIVTLLTNSKKDSPTRKNEAYIIQRITTLDQTWEAVKSNHAQMTSIGIMQHTYFKANYFEQIQAKYEEAKKYLKECSKTEEPPKKPDEQTARIIKMDMMIQDFTHESLNIRRALDTNQSKSRYEILGKTLDAQWSLIQQLHNEIMGKATSIEKEYQETFWAEREKYQETMERLQEKIKKLQTATSSNLSVPTVKIPLFTGKYEDWASFYDLFCKIVHENTTISNAEKMQLLKLQLRGESHSIIKHLTISEANYDAAWSLLQSRYNNKRLITSKLVDKILDIPAINFENAGSLKNLHDVTVECLEAIKNMGFDTSSWCPFIGRIIVRKWDAETNKIFEQQLPDPKEIPSLEFMLEFLRRRFYALEAVSSATYQGRQQPSQPVQSIPNKSWSNCAACKQDHPLWKCETFRNYSVPERKQLLKEKRLCMVCLIPHYRGERCTSNSKCRICQRPHNTLIHQENESPSKPPYRSKVTHHATSQDKKQIQPSDKKEVLLATALVSCQGGNGVPQLLRVLIDQGSQISLITEEAAQLLNLPRERVRAEISGLGSDDAKISKWKVEAQLKPRFSSNYFLNVQLLTLPKITQPLPINSLPDVNKDQWRNEMLADPRFNESGPIDILLGAEEYVKIILEGLKKTDDGLIGQNSELGWFLSGLIANEQSTKVKLASMVVRKNEEDQLAKFWEIEEVSAVQHPRPDDQECEEFYVQTTKRNQDGSYTVKIPFKKNTPELGNSKGRAVARLQQLEKKFTRDPTLHQQYANFMEEYLRLGHMRKVPANELNQGKYYIPHQAVIRDESTSSKLRVVFDASCKSSTNICLNDFMHVCSRLQHDLVDIILR